MLKSLIVVAALAAVAPAAIATAAPAHLTDSQYLTAVRCQALIGSPNLGKGDTAAVDALIKAQASGREGAVFDRAAEVRSDAVRQAGHAGPSQKAQLIAERAGACRVFGDEAVNTAAAQIAQPTGAN
jgi:hypothetical protein